MAHHWVIIVSCYLYEHHQRFALLGELEDFLGIFELAHHVDVELGLGLIRMPFRQLVDRKWFFRLLPLFVQPLQIGITEKNAIFILGAKLMVALAAA